MDVTKTSSHLPSLCRSGACAGPREYALQVRWATPTPQPGLSAWLPSWRGPSCNLCHSSLGYSSAFSSLHPQLPPPLLGSWGKAAIYPVGLVPQQFATQFWPHSTHRHSGFPGGYPEGSYRRTWECGVWTLTKSKKREWGACRAELQTFTPHDPRNWPLVTHHLCLLVLFSGLESSRYSCISGLHIPSLPPKAFTYVSSSGSYVLGKLGKTW